MTLNTENSNTKTIQDLHQDLINFSTKKVEFDEMKRRLIEDFRQSLNEMASNIFIAIPQLKTIHWHQFTPYFNDGDELIFNVRAMFFYNHTPNQYIRDLYDYEEAQEDNPDKSEHDWCFELDSYYSRDKQLEKAKNYLSNDEVNFIEKFSKTINSNKDFVQEIFGDHCIVIFNKDGITIEDYSDHY